MLFECLEPDDVCQKQGDLPKVYESMESMREIQLSPFQASCTLMGIATEAFFKETGNSITSADFHPQALRARRVYHSYFVVLVDISVFLE